LEFQHLLESFLFYSQITRALKRFATFQSLCLSVSNTSFISFLFLILYHSVSTPICHSISTTIHLSLSSYLPVNSSLSFLRLSPIYHSVSKPICPSIFVTLQMSVSLSHSFFCLSLCVYLYKTLSLYISIYLTLSLLASLSHCLTAT